MTGGAGDSKRGGFIPALRYREAARAIDWLCAAFGFERHLVMPGEGGTIEHAQLTTGLAMIMLGTVRDDAFGGLQRTPAAAGGVVAQSPYLVVADVDAHHARAVAAGIVMPLKDEDHGGRGHSCRDIEGHLWNFGNYDPWAAGPGA